MEIREIISDNTKWELELKDTHTVEFFGFHRNRPLTYDSFSEFFAEN